MIRIQPFTFNLFSENTYVLWDEETLESAIIDPGCSDSDEENYLENFISNKNLNVKYLINTHCHIDHILGNEYIKKKYDPQYLIPEFDLPLLENAAEQARMFGLNYKYSAKPDEYLSEDKNINLGSAELKFLFTPGHTPGEYCIYIPSIKSCITGDVLFNDSIGRTDLWGGDYDTLIASINSKLLTLPEDTIIYPGHGDSSTIGKEKKFNPFLNNIV